MVTIDYDPNQRGAINPNILNTPPNPEQEKKSPNIAFARFMPTKQLSVETVLSQYPNVSPEYVREKIGTRTLYEASPEDRQRDIPYELAVELIQKTGEIPDLIFICSSHLPKNPKEQPVALRLWEKLKDQGLKLAEPTKEPAHTFSAACASLGVALDKIRKLNPQGKKIMILIEELGYRETLPPASEDRQLTRLIFSDMAVGMMATYGEDFEVIASMVENEPDEANLLSMRTPTILNNDFITEYSPPQSEYFTMQGPQILRRFNQLISKEKINAIVTSAAEKETDIQYDENGKPIVDFALIHQASRRMVDWGHSFFNAQYKGNGIETYGNTSSASTLLDLQDGIESGVIKSGNIGFELVFGGGLTWAFAILTLKERR